MSMLVRLSVQWVLAVLRFIQIIVIQGAAEKSSPLKFFCCFFSNRLAF